jgi:hypothetical protein
LRIIRDNSTTAIVIRDGICCRRGGSLASIVSTVIAFTAVIVVVALVGGVGDKGS